MDSAKYGPVLEFVRSDVQLHLSSPRFYEQPKVALEIFRYLYSGADSRLKGMKKQPWLNYFDRECRSISDILVDTRPFSVRDAIDFAEVVRSEIAQLMPDLGAELEAKYPRYHAA